jgi:hypothetical protein
MLYGCGGSLAAFQGNMTVDWIVLAAKKERHKSSDLAAMLFFQGLLGRSAVIITSTTVPSLPIWRLS